MRIDWAQFFLLFSSTYDSFKIVVRLVLRSVPVGSVKLIGEAKGKHRPYREGRPFQHVLARCVNAQLAAFGSTPAAAFGALVGPTLGGVRGEGAAQIVGEGDGARLGMEFDAAAQRHV